MVLHRFPDTCTSIKMLTEAAVRTWMFDDRIIGDIVWTPIRPGNHGDWKQDLFIRNIFAACDSGCERRDCGTDTGTRRLEEWVGRSSEKIHRGGRPGHTSADRGPAGDGGSEAASGAAAPPPRGRGRPGRSGRTPLRRTPSNRRRYAVGSTACAWRPPVISAPW
jgi:hypothetical protein